LREDSDGPHIPSCIKEKAGRFFGKRKVNKKRGPEKHIAG